MKSYYNLLILIALTGLIQSCNHNGLQKDASGVFESEEIIVSSEVIGKVIDFKVEEGSLLEKDSIVGKIDPIQYELQSEQIASSIKAVDSKTVSAVPQVQILQAQMESQNEQIKVLQLQLKNALYEKIRVEKMVKADAAPVKQLDDLNSQIVILEQQIKTAQSQIALIKQQIQSQRELIQIQNRAITSEKEPLEKRKAMVDDYLKKALIKNPRSGTLLTKYIHEGEIVTIGKAIYKLANLDELYLRAYITGSQLTQLKINQQVKIFVDDATTGIKEYTGIVSFISDKAEFTPKTIQTKDERANLVYAVKIRVKNDGYLKLGMYGEVKFN